MKVAYVLLATALAGTQPDDSWFPDNQPVEPFRIADNV